MRTCSKCNEVKPFSEYYRHPRGVDGYFGHCKMCERARSRDAMRRVREADPNYATNAALKKNYGITLADYARMLAEQNGRCAICGALKPGGRGKRFHVDHDHDSGVIRGLLCRGCNTGIGALGDNPDRLLAAVTYLLQSSNVLEI